MEGILDDPTDNQVAGDEPAPLVGDPQDMPVAGSRLNILGKLRNWLNAVASQFKFARGQAHVTSMLASMPEAFRGLVMGTPTPADMYNLFEYLGEAGTSFLEEQSPVVKAVGAQLEQELWHAREQDNMQEFLLQLQAIWQSAATAPLGWTAQGLPAEEARAVRTLVLLFKTSVHSLLVPASLCMTPEDLYRLLCTRDQLQGLDVQVKLLRSYGAVRMLLGRLVPVHLDAWTQGCREAVGNSSGEAGFHTNMESMGDCVLRRLLDVTWPSEGDPLVLLEGPGKVPVTVPLTSVADSLEFQQFEELLAKLLLWSPNSITALGAVVGLQNVELLAALQALVAIPRVLHQDVVEQLVKGVCTMAADINGSYSSQDVVLASTRHFRSAEQDAEAADRQLLDLVRNKAMDPLRGLKQPPLHAARDAEAGHAPDQLPALPGQGAAAAAAAGDLGQVPRGDGMSPRLRTLLGLMHEAEQSSKARCTPEQACIGRLLGSEDWPGAADPVRQQLEVRFADAPPEVEAAGGMPAFNLPQPQLDADAAPSRQQPEGGGSGAGGSSSTRLPGQQQPELFEGERQQWIAAVLQQKALQEHMGELDQHTLVRLVRPSDALIETFGGSLQTLVQTAEPELEFYFNNKGRGIIRRHRR